jgi:aspartyl-tRNA synthetase
MSFVKKPFKKLRDLNHSSDSNNTSTDSVPSKTEGIHSDATTGSSSNSTLPYGNVPSGNVANRHATNSNSPNSRRRSQEIINEEKKRPSRDKECQKAETKKRDTMTRVEDEKFVHECPPELSKLYRPYSMNMSKKRTHENRILFKDIDFESK